MILNTCLPQSLCSRPCLRQLSSSHPPPSVVRCLASSSLASSSEPPKGSDKESALKKDARPKRGPSPPRPKESKNSNQVWRLFNVKVPAAEDPGKDDFGIHPALLKSLAKRIGIKLEKLGGNCVSIVRKSFDARKLSSKCWVYVVDVPQEAAPGARLFHRPGQLELLPQAAKPELPFPSSNSASKVVDPLPVVVVGSGPAGLFAALEVAEAGLPVMLLERGQPVDLRGKDIGALFVRRQLNAESNLCFGEGGAGTWSDGKLTTRIGRNEDPVRHVLQVLCDLGAPQSILVSGKPHLGTDRLVRILRAFREKLKSMGVDVRFGTRVEQLIVLDGSAAGVRLADGSEVAASRVVLAVGHSSRDMYTHLASLDVAISPKPFSVGFRIEHPQSLVDQIQYGERDAAEFVMRGKGPIPVAEYRLTANFDEGEEEGAQRRGVYSFCMCPGGQIVPTSNRPDELCINGMSFSRRDSRWANSALVVSVSEADWAHLSPQHGALAGVEYQREIEREAARRGGGNLVAPVQRVPDYLAGQPSTGELPSSSYRLGIKAAPLHDLYSNTMYGAFRKALTRFEATMPGFCGPSALLHAAETRTSAPVRIERGENTQSVSLRNLHPCGEGAGYAGGIVSSAVDGVHVGRQIAAELTGRSDLAEAAENASHAGVKAGY